MKKIAKVQMMTLLCGFILCFFACLSFNCIETPLSPVAPASQIGLVDIPIMDVTKYMSEVQGKAKGTTIDSTTGTISYIATQSMPPKSIGVIQMQPSASGQQVGVGQFTIQGLPSRGQDLTLSQMGIPAGDYPGAAVFPFQPFPSYYISMEGDTLNFSSQFDFVGVSSGILTLTFKNNLPLRIDFNRPIILRNNQLQPSVDNSVIATFNVGIVDSFATYVGTASLANKIMRGQLKLDSISFSTEQRSTPFSLNSQNGISAQFSSGDITADSASAVIPSQTVASISDSTFVVDDSVVVEKAIFSGGSFNIALENNLGIEVGVEFKIDEIVSTTSGASFTIDTTLHANQTAAILFDAKYWQIQTAASQLGTKLHFSIGINTINSDSLKEKVTKNDFVRASIVPGTALIVKSVTGKIKPQNIQINSSTISGFNDVTNLNAKILLKGVGLIVRFPMTGGFPMDYHIIISAKKNGNILGSIPIGTDLGFPRIFPNNPVIPISNAPGFDNFLSSFFPTTPDSFYVNGTLTLDPLDEFNKSVLYSIYDTTKVYPSLDVNFPFAAGIQNGKLTEMTSFGKDVIPKDFTKYVDSGAIAFSIVNHIPVEVAFRARFLGNNSQNKWDTLLYLPKSPPSSYTINAAQYDTVSNLVTSASASEFSISLNKSEMVLFNKSDSVYVIFDLNTSNHGKYAKVRETDYIRVYAKGTLKCTLKPGE